MSLYYHSDSIGQFEWALMHEAALVVSGSEKDLYNNGIAYFKILLYISEFFKTEYILAS